MTTIEKKQCKKCEQVKPLTEFYSEKRVRDGKTAKCKECLGVVMARINSTFEGKCKQTVRKARYSAKSYGVESTLTLAEVKTILSAERCSYCNREVEEKKRTLDHVYAMEQGGTNTFENVVMACRTCNTAKHNRPVYDFIMKHRNSEATSALLDVLAARMELSTIEALRHLETQHTAYNEAQFMAKHYGVETQ